MKIQPIDKQNSTSMRGLYFPDKPAHMNIIEPNIRNAFKNNSYIKRLSEETDVFVRYLNAKNAYYYAKIDIVDLKTKKTKYVMSYSTDFFKNKQPDFYEEEFISNIEQPSIIQPNYKGNLSKKIGRIKRSYKE